MRRRPTQREAEIAGMTSLQASKRDLRAAARACRAAAARAAPDAAAAASDMFRRAIRLRPGAVVAGYLPIGDEIDAEPLLRRLGGDGYETALPRLARRNAALAFIAWRCGDVLEAGPFGTLQPPATGRFVVPDALIVPMLAFDRRGYRLGYGGGYYDRTLAALRRRRAITAIGIAYAAQEVAAVPHDRHDQPLDWIVTDREAIGTMTGSED